MHYIVTASVLCGSLALPTRSSAEVAGTAPTCVRPDRRAAALGCDGEPCAPGGAETPEARYRRARACYEADQLDEAATLFAEIAREHSSHELAVSSANLHLDALNQIATLDAERRLPCRQELAAAVDRYRANEDLLRDQGLRELLDRLWCSIRRLRGEAFMEAERFDEAAEAYWSIFEAGPERCSRDGSHDMCEALWNCAIAFEAGGRMESAIRTRRALVDECGSSRLAGRTLHVLGGNYHALADFEEAARHYERYARTYPGEENAPEALRNAIVFRMARGETEEAAEDVAFFERAYRSRLKSETITVVYALGQVYLREGTSRAAEKHYDRFLRRYGQEASGEELIGAHRFLGLARWEQGERRHADAEKAFRAAVDLADSGRPPHESLRDRIIRYREMVSPAGGFRPGEEPEATARILHLATAVGQSWFYLAEAERARVEAIRVEAPRTRRRALPGPVRVWAKSRGQSLGALPEPGDSARIVELQVEHWLEERFMPRWRERAAAVERAEVLYARAIEEDVPEWEVASWASLGDMSLHMATTAEGLGLEPLAAERVEALARPFRQRAVAAFTVCLDEAVSTRRFSDRSLRCEEQLLALDPERFRKNDGFWAEPVYTPGLLALPPVLATE